jgi:hypothetical protein
VACEEGVGGDRTRAGSVPTLRQPTTQPGGTSGGGPGPPQLQRPKPVHGSLGRINARMGAAATEAPEDGTLPGTDGRERGNWDARMLRWAKAKEQARQAGWGRWPAPIGAMDVMSQRDEGANRPPGEMIATQTKTAGNRTLASTARLNTDQDRREQDARIHGAAQHRPRPQKTACSHAPLAAALPTAAGERTFACTDGRISSRLFTNRSKPTC